MPSLSSYRKTSFLPFAVFAPWRETRIGSAERKRSKIMPVTVVAAPVGDGRQGRVIDYLAEKAIW